MPQVIEKLAYTFDELSDKAKEKVVQRHGDWATNHNWWEFTYEDAKAYLARFGYGVKDIYFSGFWSQGDGACFTGSWNPQLVNLNGFEDEYGDEKLHAFAERLRTMLVANRLLDRTLPSMKISDARHNCVTYDVDWSCTEFSDIDLDDMANTFAEELISLSGDLMHYIYRSLEAEHEYLTCEESVKEMVADDLFDENGELI